MYDTFEPQERGHVQQHNNIDDRLDRLEALPPGTSDAAVAGFVSSGPETTAALDAATAALVPDSGTATGAALSAAIVAGVTQRETHVTVGPTGQYTSLSDALAAYPSGGVDIEMFPGLHSLPAPLTASGVTNVTIRGQGREATRVDCAAQFAVATNSSDQWTIRDLFLNHVAGANTDDGIDVDYPRRWSVRGLRLNGFGGASIHYRGGLQSEVLFNSMIAKDSANTNGLAGICIEKSLGGVVGTTMRTQGNYIQSGKQYGMLITSANVGSVFSSDAAEYCTVGMRFVACGGELHSPYTEGNATGIQLVDSAMSLIGWVRDEPVVTWVNVASADRVITRVDRYYMNPGKAIIYGGSTGGNNPTTSPSIRWGTGAPEGAQTGAVGSLWIRTDGSTTTTVYVKESGTGNTGWIAK